MATNYEVVQAQRDYSDAQNSELRAIANYRKALVAFESAQTVGTRGVSAAVSGGGAGRRPPPARRRRQSSTGSTSSGGTRRAVAAPPAAADSRRPRPQIGKESDTRIAMKKLTWIVILLVLLGAAGAVFYANRGDKEPRSRR